MLMTHKNCWKTVLGLSTLHMTGWTVKDVSSTCCVVGFSIWPTEGRIWSLHPICYSYLQARSLKRLCQIVIKMGHKCSLVAIELLVVSRWKKIKNASPEDAKICSTYVVWQKRLETVSFWNEVTPRWNKDRRKTLTPNSVWSFNRQWDTGWAKISWGKHPDSWRKCKMWW